MALYGDQKTILDTLTLALDCLRDLYGKVERDTGSDTEEQGARYRVEQVEEAMARVRAIGESTEGEGDHDEQAHTLDRTLHAP